MSTPVKQVPMKPSKQKLLARKQRPQQTHLTAEEGDERHKKLYVVREPDWTEKVWGAYLSFKDASELKERIAGMQRSHTVMMEEMPTDPDFLAFCASAEFMGNKAAPAAGGPTPEQVAKAKAQVAELDAKRAQKAAEQAVAEAKRRAQIASDLAQKAVKEAEEAAAAADKMAAVPSSTGDDLAPPEDPSEAAKVAEAEILEDAPIEDILGE